MVMRNLSFLWEMHKIVCTIGPFGLGYHITMSTCSQRLQKYVSTSLNNILTTFSVEVKACDARMLIGSSTIET
jgi:hypothetical protein